MGLLSLTIAANISVSQSRTEARQQSWHRKSRLAGRPSSRTSSDTAVKLVHLLEHRRWRRSMTSSICLLEPVYALFWHVFTYIAIFLLKLILFIVYFLSYIKLVFGQTQLFLFLIYSSQHTKRKIAINKLTYANLQIICFIRI